jgi:hypothetical protein
MKTRVIQDEPEEGQPADVERPQPPKPVRPDEPLAPDQPADIG